jgi:hypothetical protein
MQYLFYILLKCMYGCLTILPYRRWTSNALGRKLLVQIICYLISLRDIQTTATVICTLGGYYRLHTYIHDLSYLMYTCMYSCMYVRSSQILNFLRCDNQWSMLASLADKFSSVHIFAQYLDRYACMYVCMYVQSIRYGSHI